MNKAIAAILIGLMSLAGAAAAATDMHECGGFVIMGRPTGELDEYVDNVGLGLSVQGGARPNPFMTFGLGANYMMYGSSTISYRVPLVDDIDIKTSHNIAGLFVYAQLRPIPGPFQPYLEAKAGMNLFWTMSKLVDGDGYDDTAIARKVNCRDFARTWGVGGGVRVKLGESSPYDVIHHTVFLDLKVMRMRGERARYATEGDLVWSNGNLVFQLSDSETDLTVIKFGFTVSWE